MLVGGRGKTVPEQLSSSQPSQGDLKAPPCLSVAKRITWFQRFWYFLRAFFCRSSYRQRFRNRSSIRRIAEFCVEKFRCACARNLEICLGQVFSSITTCTLPERVEEARAKPSFHTQHFSYFVEIRVKE